MFIFHNDHDDEWLSMMVTGNDQVCDDYDDDDL